jgi:hypothetical protein
VTAAATGFDMRVLADVNNLDALHHHVRANLQCAGASIEWPVELHAFFDIMNILCGFDIYDAYSLGFDSCTAPVSVSSYNES